VGLRSGGKAPPAKELPAFKRGSAKSTQLKNKTKDAESESEDEKPPVKKSKLVARMGKKPMKSVDQVILK
jgi:hypothetical protein